MILAVLIPAYALMYLIVPLIGGPATLALAIILYVAADICVSWQRDFYWPSTLLNVTLILLLVGAVHLAGLALDWLLPNEDGDSILLAISIGIPLIMAADLLERRYFPDRHRRKRLHLADLMRRNQRA